jgi:hypothetical protein
MLRLVQVGNALPDSRPVDPIAEFQSGMIGQLYARGGKAVCGVSDGTAPYGILDDIRTKSFTAAAIDEMVIVPNVPAKKVGSKWVTDRPVYHLLNNSNIIADSFVSRNLDAELRPINGVLIFPEETELNLQIDDSSSRPDSLKTIVSYMYQIPNTPGDDTTLGSGRVTIWFHRGIYLSDQFDTTARYPLSHLLFVNEKGLLTTKRLAENYPGVAMVTSPPTMINGGFLEFLWL